MDNVDKLELMDQVIELIATTEDPDEISQKLKEMGFQQTEKNGESNAYLSPNGDFFIVDLFDICELRIYELIHWSSYSNYKPKKED